MNMQFLLDAVIILGSNIKPEVGLWVFDAADPK